MIDLTVRALAYQMFERQAETYEADAAPLWIEEEGVRDFWCNEAAFVLDVLREMEVLPE